MNTLKFFQCFVLFAFILLLGISGCTASESDSPQIEGSCQLFEGPDSPEERDWYSDDGMLHLRDDTNILSCETNDERLNGDFIHSVNFDGQSDLTGFFHGIFTQEDENGDIRWQGGYYARAFEDGYFYAEVLLYGLGEYEGLQARLITSKSAADSDYPLIATIEEVQR